MGKAYKPPSETYRRERFVAVHAIERFRERIAGTDLVHRDDRDVGNALDQAVAWATNQGRAEAINDKGVPATLVDVGGYVPQKEDSGLFAVVKTHGNPQPGDPRTEIIVTVMTAEQVEVMRRTRWRGPDPSKLFNPALAGLKDLDLDLSKSSSKKTASPSSRRDSDRKLGVLVSYCRHLSGRSQIHYEEYGADDARKRLAELASDSEVIENSIRLWIERPVTIKREVKVEVDL
ncbi:MAG: hypothetical protein JSV86_16795 [Gemmatimonadota bacterium]|nr:MAG: hypothetical protein JSV86_16795 [Gemmatimonadota bacterium]